MAFFERLERGIWYKIQWKQCENGRDKSGLEENKIQNEADGRIEEGGECTPPEPEARPAVQRQFTHKKNGILINNRTITERNAGKSLYLLC